MPQRPAVVFGLPGLSDPPLGEPILCLPVLSPNRQLVVAIILSLLFTAWVLRMTFQRSAEPEEVQAATAPPPEPAPRARAAAKEIATPDAGAQVTPLPAPRAEAAPRERPPRRAPSPPVADPTPTPVPTPAPPKAAAKGKTPPPAAHEGTGRLTLDTRPTTEVFLGQTSLGNTPLVNAELPSGHQVLQLVNEDKGISQSFEVEIRSGENTQKRLNLSP
jgi:hypothetical protein